MLFTDGRGVLHIILLTFYMLYYWKICQFWTQQWQQGISLIIHIFGLSSEERHNEISARLEFDKFGLDFYCRIYGPSLQVELKKKSEVNKELFSHGRKNEDTIYSQF